MPESRATSVSPAMRPREQRFGLGCALITPFAADGGIDHSRLVAHARYCLDEGCASITFFGTTGEGASVGLAARAAALERVAGAGFDLARQVLVGVASAAVDEAVAQANQLLDAGGRGLLLAPPFYFKGVGDEGLYRWFSTVLERCRAPREVILYHIPSVTAVPLSSALIGRLACAFPGVIAGIKDSSGDWATTKRYLADHPGLHVLVGDERQLARAVRHGGSGAINGFSNFCARLLRPMVDDGTEAPGVAALVDTLLELPVTPAVKALVAHRAKDTSFLRTAPPLVPIDAATCARLGAALDALLAGSAGAPPP
jgi:4-hydroxy-tetrahydrodipicolinate synthase